MARFASERRSRRRDVPARTSSRPAKRARETAKVDPRAAEAEAEKRIKDHQEALIDESLEETFPGSDPISPHHVT
jgi:hypothetical protein